MPRRMDGHGHVRLWLADLPEAGGRCHQGFTSTIRGRLGAKNSPRRFRREDGVPAAEEDEVEGRLMMPTGRGR